MSAPLPLLQGPAAAAIRRPKSAQWTVYPGTDLDRRERLPLGLELSLGRPDTERRGAPDTNRRRVRLGLPMPRFAHGAVVVAAAGVGLLLAGLAGVAAGSPARGPLLVDLPDLVQALGAAAAAWIACTAGEALALGNEVRGSAPRWGLGWGGPATEGVAWRLGISDGAAGAALLLAMGGALAAVAALARYPAPALGTLAGCLLYLIPALNPLAPSPGARILGELFRTSDLATQLRWALATRFLAPAARGGAQGPLVAAGLGLVGWVMLTGICLWWLGQPERIGLGLAGQLWRTLVLAASVGVAAWLALRLSVLLRRALTVREEGEPDPVEPSAEAIAGWREQSALLAHVPGLADAGWRWASVPAGRYLIRHGATDRRFYWLAGGRALVVVRDGQGLPLPVAQLTAGAGVGEIALLEDRPRTADVFVEADAVVATLDHEAFAAACGEAGRERFRDVVLASQALARSPVFAGLPPSQRERWLRAGEPRRFRSGEAIIRQGERDRWLGLVATGRCRVVRDGEQLAELGADTVVGEIALVTGSSRTATVEAIEPVVLWRWDPDWLTPHLADTAIGTALAELAAQRTGDEGP